MFKYLAALALAAVVGGGALAAEERTNWNTLPMDVDAILAGKQNPNNVVASTPDNEALLKALADIKDDIVAKDADVNAKRLYVHAVAVMFARTHRDASYDDMLAELDKACVEVGFPDFKDEGWYHSWKAFMVNPIWYAGHPDKAKMEQCIKKFKDDTHENTRHLVGRLMAYLGYPADQWVPLAANNVGGKQYTASVLINSTNDQEHEQGAKLYWELALNGNLAVNMLTNLYQRVISYELTKDGYNAEELKSKLHRAITVHKIKARTWKPSKEGEENPWLAFVGAMQDTLKDL